MSIGSATENQFVTTHLLISSWIGANDIATEGQWRWAQSNAQFWQGAWNGSAVGGAYKSWTPLQPDNLFNQDCGTTSALGVWTDEACGALLPYVCEGVVDLCPNDPNKVEPGQCLCGNPDTDSDNDGTADCNDGCASDPGKTAPGVCGCGIADGDADNDGVTCADLCPNDQTKTTPGDCGCASAPLPSGTSCDDGLCSANTQCNGAGSCGTASQCTAPDGDCTFGMRADTPYWFCNNDRLHSDALQRCRSVGMELAVIESAGEDTFITQRAHEHSFIGGSDQTTEGTWLWLSTGAQFWQGTWNGSATGGAYTNFALGEPSNLLSGNDCMVKSLLSGGQWKSHPCSFHDAFVCERPVIDLCPDDPFKLFPGVCDCGVADDDSDADGTLDCNDRCPHDPTTMDSFDCASPYACRQTAGLQPGAIWPMRGGCPQGRGHSSRVGSHDGVVNWSVDVGGEVHSSPAIGVDDSIYVGSDSGMIYALRPDGTTTWSAATGGWIRSSPTLGANGNLYVGSDDDHVYARDIATGAARWSFDTGGDVRSSPTVGTDGTVYVGSDSNRVYALDGVTGGQLWTFDTGGDIRSTAAIGPTGNLFVGSSDSFIYALRPDVGLSSEERLLWKTQLSGSVLSMPVIGFAPEFVVYAVSAVGTIYKLDPFDGTIIWQVQVVGAVQGSLALGPLGRIFVGNDAGRVYAFEDRDESVLQLWSFDVGAAVRASPVLGADGTVYVGADNGFLYALDPRPDVTQRVIFQTYLGDSVRSTAAVGRDGAVYVGSTDGALHSIGDFDRECPLDQSCHSFAGINYCGIETPLSSTPVPPPCSATDICPPPGECIAIMGVSVCYQACNPEGQL